MNRPDLDDIEANVRGGGFPGGSESRTNWSALVLRLITYARHLESRIAELEEALERIAGDSFGDAHSSDIAAEVLKRKGA